MPQLLLVSASLEEAAPKGVFGSYGSLPNTVMCCGLLFFGNQNL